MNNMSFPALCRETLFFRFWKHQVSIDECVIHPWPENAKEQEIREPSLPSFSGCIHSVCIVFSNNDEANSFWEKMDYSLRTNINYRNKSLNDQIPKGE